MAKQEKQSKVRKAGRNARKASRRGSPISLFVRNKITGEKYFKLTKQG
jgi:hypothetical protein